MKIAFAKPELPADGAVVVAVFEGRALSPAARQLDERSGGALSRAMAAGRFEGKKDQTLTVLAPAGLALNRVVLVGVGKAEAVDTQGAEGFGGTALAQLLTSGEAAIAIAADWAEGTKLSAAELAARIAFGARLRGYRFDRYFTKEKKEDKPSVKKVAVLTDAAAGAKAAFAPLDKVADGVFLTRDVVSEPANVITPEALAAEASKLSELGVEVEVLGEKQMRKLGMGALLGVGQGSERESQLVVMRWTGARDPEAAPLVLVGKGVCFDSGGISIKPSGGMEDMKWDMAGAGAVIGAMKALAGRKAKANVVGIVGLVENMPSGTAQRPGDVVTSMSGQTVEVLNTDAEGRLVLCDALWYAKERFKPKAMIDLATLTGAIIIALGNEYAGLFAGDDALAEAITAAGKAVGEPVWRMPLGEAYDKQLKSDIADMKNIGGREGGSITAAQFLKRFVGDVPWAHLDIAGTAWSKKDTATVPKGATAYGVRLLDRLVATQYEDR
ncbi:leucyl aminopeptidase [Magnetospirillum sp. UT-4]|uniref:leucyl aminopeptidase n=1 Tax=Magnetospirillum sp. UT-4 TaxID=2681467 RepID=UPI0013861872|nr:leucyl aminopeptidase [Magnetospirillum sp. UT-4]CAA7614693.1 aminopeptidase A, a cyteinylglycinase [Magnetospirillum sp. UT-4]